MMDGYPSDCAGWPWTPEGDLDAPMPLEPAAPIRLPTFISASAVVSVSWADLDGETLGAWVQAADGGRFRLLVETLPGGGWDWVIWHTRDRSHSDCGQALTALRAMVAAEQALARIAGESLRELRKTMRAIPAVSRTLRPSPRSPA